MPGMDGIELAKSVSELEGARPMVVFLSAYDNFKYAQNAIRYGVRYYVLKPTNFSELKEIFGTIRHELDAKYNVSSDDAQDYSTDEIIQKVLSYLSQNYIPGNRETDRKNHRALPSYS